MKMKKVVTVVTIAELQKLCNSAGVTLHPVKMYRKGYLNVALMPHLSEMIVEFSSERESAAVRAAVKELRSAGMLGCPFD